MIWKKSAKLWLKKEVNKMNNIKILDCTLRDGGYINNWNFKKNNIEFILKHLVLSGADYVECGFYKLNEYDIDKTFFNNAAQLISLLPGDCGKTKLTLMINYGEIPIEAIPDAKDNILLRIVFKKNRRDEALKYCEQLIQKGYEIFINPMNTITYSSKEMLDLIEKVNEIKPAGFTIVDTTGSMKKKDLLSLLYLTDLNLDKKIALAFHSHNNLQLSFSNAQILMEQHLKRTVIIDSTVFGMGRGAGNLCTELLMQYINDNYDGKYNLIHILKIVDEQINKIFAVSPWGYSVPYYLAATNCCHPNYACFLIEKQMVPIELINHILKRIPLEKKNSFDLDFITELYNTTIEHYIDDDKDALKILNQIKGKKILILASGKNLIKQQNRINKFIKENTPYIISLNFEPDLYKPDLVFVSNLKRYNELNSITAPCAVTSNIPYPADYKLNYSSYRTNSLYADNVAIMLLNFLVTLNVPEVYLAGLDGYSSDLSENYINNDLLFVMPSENVELVNNEIKKELTKLSEKIKLNFVTDSYYGEVSEKYRDSNICII